MRSAKEIQVNLQIIQPKNEVEIELRLVPVVKRGDLQQYAGAHKNDRRYKYSYNLALFFVRSRIFPCNYSQEYTLKKIVKSIVK